MSEAIDAALVRSGTWGSLWIDGEQVAECYGCQAKISKTKESVPRCRAMLLPALSDGACLSSPSGCRASGERVGTFFKAAKPALPSV